MNDQPALFDPARTTPCPCPIGRCPAIRFPGQNRVITCVHDLEPEGKRPKGCLNTYDPTTAPFPEGY